MVVDRGLKSFQISCPQAIREKFQEAREAVVKASEGNKGVTALLQAVDSSVKAVGDFHGELKQRLKKLLEEADLIKSVGDSQLGFLVRSLLTFWFLLSRSIAP